MPVSLYSGGATIKNIVEYLLNGVKNELFNPEHAVVYQNMSRPLCDYYISSSHNSYILGNQVFGDASASG